MSTQIRRTVLHAFNVRKKARMAEFAGYEMPIQYPQGALREHLHTRQAASLFDVSHMGQVEFHGADRERFFEWVAPCDMRALGEGQASLTMLLNERGGVRDDLIVSKSPSHLFAVVNAGSKVKVLAYLRERIADFKGDVSMVEREDRTVIAIQGPKSAEVLRPHFADIDKLHFMHFRSGASIGGFDAIVTRAGYTGEDGVEVVLRNEDAEPLVELLLRDATLQLAGLAARDSLRLEAGMNLYSHELTEDTDVVAARFTWCISKRRMTEGGFIGHERVCELKAREAELVPRVRVGFVSVERGPVARHGTLVHANGNVVGTVTSGGPSPTLGKNIGMAYVDRAFSAKGQPIELEVRGKKVPGEIVPPRFVPLRYFKG